MRACHYADSAFWIFTQAAFHGLLTLPRHYLIAISTRFVLNKPSIKKGSAISEREGQRGCNQRQSIGIRSNLPDWKKKHVPHLNATTLALLATSAGFSKFWSLWCKNPGVFFLGRRVVGWKKSANMKQWVAEGQDTLHFFNLRFRGQDSWQTLWMAEILKKIMCEDMFVFFCEPSPNFLSLKQGGGLQKTHTHIHQEVEEGLLARSWPSELWKPVGFSVGFLCVIIDDSNNLPSLNLT